MAQFVKIVHELEYPITVADVTYTSVTLHEPDVGMLEDIQALDLPEGENTIIPMKQVREIIQILTKLPEEVCRRFHRNDYKVLGDKGVPLVSSGSKNSGSTTETQ